MTLCAQCGQENRAEARFCDACGASLVPTPLIREERKVVSVLFVDLVGFTATSERLDPEDVDAFLDPYWRQVRAEIELHGGTVEKFIGDAVVGLFGAPVAHEDDPERAVRAALAIRDWAREQEAIQVRVGVTTGDALVRLGAQPLAGEGFASGDVINTASRLQTAAAVNAILVDERTRRATRDVIDYAEASRVAAKGKAEPIRVWEAVQARSRFGVDLFQHARTSLVGRQLELDVLKGAFRRMREERSPQLVTLVGVPGIGKSRLVYELMQAIGDDAGGLVTWRQGRSLPYGDGVSFWALAEIVKAQAGILETDDSAEAEAKLVRAVQTIVDDAAEAEWVERQLRPLVGIGGDGGSSSERQGEAFAAWRRFLDALADARPTVLVFEDLHWADEGLLDFVDSLVEWVRDVPLLIVATARPELLERRPSWAGGKANATTLSLSPLSEEETVRLVGQLVDQSELTSEIERALVGHAAGNALYAEQYARMWQERGHTDELPPPETVQGIIAARLDALSPNEKRLLQNAAVFGKVFWEGAVNAVNGVKGEEVALCLNALERKEFVQRARRSSVEAETEYAFRHVLVRDVAYGQIPRLARAAKHERAAAWIESLGRAEDHAEMLAHHYLSAFELGRAAGRGSDELTELAVLSLIRAGEHASALYAFRPAAAFYERASQLLPEEDGRRPQVLFEHARALFASGEKERAEALERARTTLLAAGDVESAAEAETLLADVAWVEARRSASDEHLQRAITLIENRAPTPAKAHVLTAVARFRMLTDEFDEAIRAGEEALTLTNTLALDELKAHTLISLGTARWRSGDRRGLADVERGLALAVEKNTLSAARRGYTNLAVIRGGLGDLGGQVELLEDAELTAQRLGNLPYLRYVGATLAWLRYFRGEWESASRFCEEFLTECDMGSPHLQESTIRLLRARMRLARDDESGAIDDIEAALSLMRSPGIPENIVSNLVEVTEIYLELGRAEEAQALAAEILSYDPQKVQKALDGLARQADRLKLSRSDLQPLLDSTPTRPFWREAAERLLTGGPTEAAAFYAEIGSPAIEADARRQAGAKFVDCGRYGEAKEQLEQALVFYRSVGASRYIREAEALLTGSQPEQAPAAPRPRLRGSSRP